MQKVIAKSATFGLFAMSSAMRVQVDHSNTDATEFIETFLRGFVGDAFTTELQACFASQIDGEAAGVQAALDSLKAGDAEQAAAGLTDIVLAWPALLGECTDAGSERVEAFYEAAAEFADPEALEAVMTARLAASPEDTASTDGGAPTTALAQLGGAEAQTCWVGTRTRGAGYARNYCPPGKTMHQGLCYKKCKKGYYGAGPVCW